MVNFVELALPLYQLLKKGMSFHWTLVEQQALDQLKLALTTSTVLIYFNFEQSFLLQIDATNDVLGAILTQTMDGYKKVVSYASCIILKAEQNYTITNKEGLTLIFAIKYFQPYPHGFHFTVETNCAPLKALQMSWDLRGRLARWA